MHLQLQPNVSRLGSLLQIGLAHRELLAKGLLLAYALDGLADLTRVVDVVVLIEHFKEG